MTQLTTVELSPANQIQNGASDDDAGEGMAGIINTASLSGSEKKTTGTKEVGDSGAKSVLKRISGWIPFATQTQKQTSANIAVVLASADESNISKKRAMISQAVDGQDETPSTPTPVIVSFIRVVRPGSVVLSSPEPTPRRSSRSLTPRDRTTARTGDMENEGPASPRRLRRPTNPLTGASKPGQDTANKERSKGRQDPYDGTESPPLASTQVQPNADLRKKMKKGLKPKQSFIGKEKEVATEEPEIEEEDVESPASIQNRKQAISPRTAESSSPNKRLTRNKPLEKPHVPTNRSKSIDRTTVTRDSVREGSLVSGQSAQPSRRKRGRPRKDQSAEKQLVGVDSEPREQGAVSSSKKRPGQILPAQKAAVKKRKPSKSKNGQQYREDSVEILPKLYTPDFSEAESRPNSPGIEMPAQRIPYRSPLNAEVKYQQLYQKQFAQRAKLLSKDSYFQRNREILGLPPVGSQQSAASDTNLSRAQSSSQALTLPNSSQIRDPPRSSRPSSLHNGDLNLIPLNGHAWQLQRELAAVEEKERQLALEKHRLRQAFEDAKEAGMSSGQAIDVDERLHMFGVGKSSSSKPRKWSLKEMTLLIEGLRVEQGPDRYEQIRMKLPDRNYDEIFDMAKYFKETMMERDKEKRQKNPFTAHPPLEEFIRSIGSESQALG